MIVCYDKKRALPTVISKNDGDSLMVKRLKRIISNMTKFKPNERKDIGEVEEELLGNVCSVFAI